MPGSSDAYRHAIRGAAAPDPAGAPAGRRPTAAGLKIAAGTALLWAGAATWYIATRDDLAQRFFAHQAEMRYAYEDRIADLKGRLEREITQNLVERNGFTARVDALARRQAEIEARQSWLGGLADRAGARSRGGTAATADRPVPEMPAPAPAPVPSADAPRKPAPLGEPLRLRPANQDHEPASPRDRLSAVEASLLRVSLDTVGLASLLTRASRERALRVRLAIEATGLDLRRLAPAEDAPVGGPLISVRPDITTGTFAPLVAETETGMAELERVLASAQTLPLRRPLPALDQTSSFGYRVDPFTRAPALHTGIDLRAEPGAPVRATAAGRVVTAEYSGGYGNMVEVEHGAGVSTRYGHLSAILVAPGATVAVGQVVGRAGSTGRSTGTHLHYETRINGEPVNPVRFLEAARLLDLADGRS